MGCEGNFHDPECLATRGALSMAQVQVKEGNDERSVTP
jgi:hypothetical protein